MGHPRAAGRTLPGMLGTYASAAFVCVGALLLGQAVLRLCGATRWSWLSAPLGLAVLILVAVPSLHVPGRASAVAVVLCVLLVASAVWLLRTAAHRPPAVGLLAGLPVALLSAVPFASAGHAGTLGWSFNNDMAAHLLLADAYRSELVERFNPLLPDYPLGPHALSAVVAQTLGVGVDEAFAGVTIAGAVLLGWTALAALRRPRSWAPLLVAPIVGMPYLIAAYYGQGAFKELLEAVFVVGFAVLLAVPPQLGRLRRWIPAALLVAGTLSVYSFLGALWPFAFLGVWLAGRALRRLAATRGSVSALWADARAEAAPVMMAVGVLLLVIVPQLPRLASFVSNRTGQNGTFIAKDDLGILVRPLPFWEAFGTWGNPDFRLQAVDHLANRAWILFVVALAVLGAIWAIRRGEWMLVAAVGAAAAIWAASERTQSPYVAAKALVLLTPLTMLMAVRALVEGGAPGRPAARWWWVVAPALAAVLVLRVGDASWGALRIAPVGPTDHLRELRALQPTLRQQPTLFLGNDDFIRWELGETPVTAPVIGFQVLPTRTEKPWTYGVNYDLDSLDNATLNRFTWVIAPRDAFASAPPPQLRPLRRTRSFVLYRRMGTIPPYGILREGEGSAAPLDCRSRRGRALMHAGGTATIRGRSVGVSAPQLAPGGSATVPLRLSPGTWDLVTPFWGPRPLEVDALGSAVTVPPNLDRPGPRWPAGRIVVRKTGQVDVRLHAVKGRWTPATALDTPGAVIAVRTGAARTVPLREACGKLVDHYQEASSDER